jgi:hypothetical protein
MVRRFVTHAFLVSLMCCALLGGADAVLLILTQRTPGHDAVTPVEVYAGGFPAQKPGDDQAVAAADGAFEQAMAKDRAALAMQTDPAFTWIDPTGMLQSRDEVLDSVAAGNAPKLVTLANATSAEVTTRVYERLALVQVHAGRSYSLRVFAKRPDGWRALHVIELTQPVHDAAAPASATGAAVPSEEGVVTDCINPCKRVPFKPSSPGAKAAFSDWLEMEQGSLTRNMDLWGRHVLDDVLIVDSGGNGTISKKQRIANTLKQKQAGVRTNEVPPVLWARTLNFGNSVLLLMLQQPYKGQPYYAARIYVNRDGRYQMAVSYHTSIASVPEFSLAKQLAAK